MKFPTEWTNNPFMFQTTNQIKTLISKNHLVQYYGVREHGGYCCLWPLERPKRLHSTPINYHQAWENSDHRPWKKQQKQLPICHHDSHPTKWSQHGISYWICLENLEELTKLGGNKDMLLCTLFMFFPFNHSNVLFLGLGQGKWPNTLDSKFLAWP